MTWSRRFKYISCWLQLSLYSPSESSLVKISTGKISQYAFELYRSLKSRLVVCKIFTDMCIYIIITPTNLYDREIFSENPTYISCELSCVLYVYVLYPVYYMKLLYVSRDWPIAARSCPSNYLLTLYKTEEQIGRYTDKKGDDIDNS